MSTTLLSVKGRSLNCRLIDKLGRALNCHSLRVSVIFLDIDIQRCFCSSRFFISSILAAETTKRRGGLPSSEIRVKSAILVKLSKNASCASFSKTLLSFSETLLSFSETVFCWVCMRAAFKYIYKPTFMSKVFLTDSFAASHHSFLISFTQLDNAY